MTSEKQNTSAFPSYWSEALVSLSAKDSVMRELIKRYRDVPFTAHASVLQSILRAIVGQQISNKAAATLWERLSHAKEGRWESFLLVIPTEKLRSLGLNPRKIAAMMQQPIN